VESVCTGEKCFRRSFNGGLTFIGSNRRGRAKWDHQQGLTLIHNQQLQYVGLSALNTVLVIERVVFPCVTPSPERTTQAVYCCMYCVCVCVCIVSTHAAGKYMHARTHTHTHKITYLLHGAESFLKS